MYSPWFWITFVLHRFRLRSSFEYRGFTFQECSLNQTKYLVEAFETGQEYVRHVVDVRTSNASSIDQDQIEKKFFGEQDAMGKQQITDLFSKIDKYWSTPVWRCTDLTRRTPDVVAKAMHWVESKPVILLHSGFFDLPLQPFMMLEDSAATLVSTGFTSASNTIAHEMAHMSCPMGMAEYVMDLPYRGWHVKGLEDTQKLALHDPEATLINADNYAWYVAVLSIKGSPDLFQVLGTVDSLPSKSVDELRSFLDVWGRRSDGNVEDRRPRTACEHRMSGLAPPALDKFRASGFFYEPAWWLTILIGALLVYLIFKPRQRGSV